MCKSTNFVSSISKCSTRAISGEIGAEKKLTGIRFSISDKPADFIERATFRAAIKQHSPGALFTFPLKFIFPAAGLTDQELKREKWVSNRYLIFKYNLKMDLFTRFSESTVF